MYSPFGLGILLILIFWDTVPNNLVVTVPIIYSYSAYLFSDVLKSNILIQLSLECTNKS